LINSAGGEKTRDGQLPLLTMDDLVRLHETLTLNQMNEKSSQLEQGWKQKQEELLASVAEERKQLAKEREAFQAELERLVLFYGQLALRSLALTDFSGLTPSRQKCKGAPKGRSTKFVLMSEGPYFPCIATLY
jgi:hypothetical protein